VIEDLVLKQMAATRASADALIHSIDMFTALIHQNTPPTPEPPPATLPGAGVDGADLATCSHPVDHRLPTPTMGNMRRQLCGVCGKEVTE